jgi:hypothetical protein
MASAAPRSISRHRRGLREGPFAEREGHAPPRIVETPAGM